MVIEKVLVVDDEILIRNFLAETLKRKNFDVYTAQDGKGAFALLKNHTFDLVITDMRMPDITGIEVLRKVKELSSQTIVVIITAFGTIENAVDAMKLGAFNYLIKPFSPDTIEAVIEKAQEHINLVEENDYLRQQVARGNSDVAQKIIAESAIMKKILGDVNTIAKSNANVFISGESGTGKEVIASAIHANSKRSARSYIKVNCAAVPENLVESEFFGHEKGAFTGANLKRIGRFELANGGSLLLDEITEIPISLQAKLLRVVQEQEFERVGGTKLIKVDVRLISTSNRNMVDAIRDKILREDLYYRLNVIPIHLPPLRDRRDDVIPIANYFLNRFCIENHKKAKTFSLDAQKKLLNYCWPGNIRELANIVERAVVMDSSPSIDSEHIYLDDSCKKLDTKYNIPNGITLREFEQRLIIEALHVNNANKEKAAQSLGISINTLINKLNEYQKDTIQF